MLEWWRSPGTKGAAMPNLYAIDDNAPYAQMLRDFLALRGSAVVPVRRTDDLNRVGAEIVRTAASHPALRGKIGQLFLMAHGDAGRLDLGTGLRRGNAWELGQVWNAMHGGLLSSVVVYGCNVASARPATAEGGGTTDSTWQTPLNRGSVTAGEGYGLLYALAQAVGVGASAAVIRQHLGPRDYERLLQGRGYQGQVMTVTPSGSFTIVRMRADGTVSEMQDSETDFV
jgi:hypothetical protein